MFIIDDNKLVKFGEILTDLRNEKNVTLRDISHATKIDIATINKLEQGLVKKINSLMLIKLADFYEVNVLYFYTLIGYISNDEVIKYNNLISYSSNNDIAIPLFENINKINIDIKNIERKINIPFSKNNSALFYSFFYGKGLIMIFYHTKILNNDDLFVFKANSQFIVSKYYILNDTIILTDILNDYKVITFNKKDVQIIGKIVYRIEELAKE